MASPWMGWPRGAGEATVPVIAAVLPGRGSVPPLLLHPGVELGAELAGGAADGLLDVLVVMAGTDGIAVARAGFEGAALVGGATLDGRVVVRQVHLEPAQAAGKAPQVLLDHRA